MLGPVPGSGQSQSRQPLIQRLSSVADALLLSIEGYVRLLVACPAPAGEPEETWTRKGHVHVAKRFCAPNYPVCKRAQERVPLSSFGCPHAVRSIDVFCVYLRFPVPSGVAATWQRIRWLGLQPRHFHGFGGARRPSDCLGTTVFECGNGLILDGAVQLPGHCGGAHTKILLAGLQAAARWAGSASCRRVARPTAPQWARATSA